MYCARCGVELQKGVKACPLCGLPAWHPEIVEEPEAGLYPRYTEGEEKVSNSGALFIVTFIFLIPLLVCIIADLNISGGISWSGYVAGGLILTYSAFCLPYWFKNHDPSVFFPLTGVLALCFALYICLKTGGHWFMPFAFPAGGALILWIEALIVLLSHAVRGVRRRILYILGGASIILGGLFILIEFLIKVAFGIPMSWWSLYPLTALTLLGIMLIVTGACRPLRESLHKKLFI